jgi:hypothetical protein
VFPKPSEILNLEQSPIQNYYENASKFKRFSLNSIINSLKNVFENLELGFTPRL